MNVIETLRARRSIRAFKPTPVDQALLRKVLDAARWAPSGGNLQPWRVIAVTGTAQQEVIDLAAHKLNTAPESEEGEDLVYPPSLWEPYRSRRFTLGEAMYATMGIGREDKAGRAERMLQNFIFFGAPVGLFFIIDRRMGRGQWAHMGMFMQSIALAACELNLGTCMQEVWASMRETLGQHFALAEHELLYCGMALGYPDLEHPVNSLAPQRAEVDEFATLLGFESMQAGDP